MMDDEIRRMAKIFKEQEDLKKLMHPAGITTIGEYVKAMEMQGHLDHLASLQGTVQAYKEAERLRRQAVIDQALNAVRTPTATEALLSFTEKNAVTEMVKAWKTQSATEEIARYALPRFPEIDRIVQMASKSLTASAYGIEIPRLQQTMMAMQAPWLDTLHAEQSVRGFVELQTIGRALKTLDPFGDQLTSALRQDLGDWRDPITVDPEVFVEPAARTSYYIDQGFQPNLTNFSDEAFEESLEHSGIIVEPSPVIVRRAPPIPPSQDPEKEEAFKRNNRAHDWLQRFEDHFRIFIEKAMAATFGADWMKQNLPNGMLDEWMEKKRKAEKFGGEEWSVIYYSDLTDYEKIICSKKNWRAFAPYFRTVDSARESLQRLYGPRIGACHGRAITSDDELYLYVEINRLYTLTQR